MPDYPQIAVHEALVNAIIHRDYMIQGSEIHIDMYDDRLEIVSPGGMVDGKRIQDLDIAKIASVRRNPIISDMFHRLRFMERRGSGLKKITKEYQNEYPPVFYSTEQVFITTLKNLNYKKNDVIENVTIKRTDKIIEIIKLNKEITTDELAKLFNVTVRTIMRDLNELKNKNIIKRVGSNKAGYWEIIKLK